MNAHSTSRTTRRTFLGAGAGIVAASLTGCGQGFGAKSGSKPGGKSSRSGFNIPDAAPGFPTDDVKFRLMDSDDTKAPYWKQFFAAFEKKFPNVACTYDGMPWERIEELAPLGFRNGSSHDLLQLPSTIPLPQAVEEKWVAPVDDAIPDFENWKKKLPDALKADGVQVFDGKLYSVPLSTDQRYQTAIHYNKKIVNDAGYDPLSTTFTWDTFREAAKKITKAGDGRVYGLVLEIGQSGRLSLIVDNLAELAGARMVDHIQQPSGEFYYTSDEVLNAIEFLQSLRADGSLLPGSNSLSAPECWPRVARGNAAMVSAGPWVTVQWNDENPDFDFAVAALPSPESEPVPIKYSPLGADSLTMASTTKVKDVAGAVLSYITSDEGQTRWGEITGVGNPPILEKARAAAAAKSEQAKQCVELSKTMVASPVAAIGNPDAASVARYEKVVSPNFGDVIQSILVGKADAKKALADLKDRSEKARDQAIAVAKKRAKSSATREDWIFRNWDPAKDYNVSDYRGR